MADVQSTHAASSRPGGPTTPASRFGSRFVAAWIATVISVGCGTRSDADSRVAPVSATARPASKDPAPTPPPVAEAALGVRDVGIWADLDDRVQLALPANLTPERVSARLDRARALLVVAIDGFPRKTYPLTGDRTLAVGDHTLALRAGDHAELAPLLTAARITADAGARDRDRDGIPDPLDVLIGAKKTVLNAAAYTEGYVRIAYPMGDVPREMGVCTDVIIRAVRNAGLDLQRALHEDIRRAKAAYPMVKGRGNPHIDHRRVATLLPYFKRHWQQRTPKLDDAADPLRPGDVIFMDTLPRAGPDHIGIVSDTVGPSGLPLVINNWTNGTRTAEMDLLPFVPVLHRFRVPE